MLHGVGHTEIHATHGGSWRSSAPISPAVTVIHAGTKKVDGKWVTNGGRVLNLSTHAGSLASARERLEEGLASIHWPGMQYRRDIGLRALRHAEAGKTVRDPW